MHAGAVSTWPGLRTAPRPSLSAAGTDFPAPGGGTRRENLGSLSVTLTPRPAHALDAAGAAVAGNRTDDLTMCRPGASKGCCTGSQHVAPHTASNTMRRLTSTLLKSRVAAEVRCRRYRNLRAVLIGPVERRERKPALDLKIRMATQISSAVQASAVFGNDLAGVVVTRP